MLNKVIWYCREKNMLKQHDRIVVGLSGGADSVCLFHLLLEIRERFELQLYGVHVNHGIRGQEASRDQEYARMLCERNDVPFFCFEAKVEELARENKISVEEAGRNYRYKCFAAVQEEVKADCIAVAHHANDQAETVLFHLARGSGVKGAAGMIPIRDNIIRPLLNCTKTDILTYLSQNKIDYYEDSTNEDRSYTRNHIRHEVIPALVDINQKAVEHICDFADIQAESLKYIEHQTNMVYNDLIKVQEEKLILNVNSLLGEHCFIQKQLILKIISQIARSQKNISKRHVDQVLALAGKPVGRQINLPYDIIAVRDYQDLIFQKAGQYVNKTNSSYKIVGLGEYMLEDWNTIIKLSILPYTKDFKVPKNVYTKAFDYDKIKGDLYIRERLSGDSIVLNAVGQRKSIKKYMIDEKIPKDIRHQIPILAAANGVLWIIGYRSGADFWVDEDTKRILLIEFCTREKEI